MNVGHPKSPARATPENVTPQPSSPPGPPAVGGIGGKDIEERASVRPPPAAASAPGPEHAPAGEGAGSVADSRGPRPDEALPLARPPRVVGDLDYLC